MLRMAGGGGREVLRMAGGNRREASRTGSLEKVAIGRGEKIHHFAPHVIVHPYLTATTTMNNHQNYEQPPPATCRVVPRKRSDEEGADRACEEKEYEVVWDRELVGFAHVTHQFLPRGVLLARRVQPRLHTPDIHTLFTVHHTLFTTHCSLFTIHCSPHTVWSPGRVAR